MSALTDDLGLALDLADAADAITLARFRAADLVVETKPDLTPVSEADRAVEQAVRERLAAVRPRDRVFGEEYGGDAAAPDGGRRWIIDPIDGTKSYVRGIPAWATLLALEQDEQIVAGVVSAPALGRRWWAARGAGAFGRDPLDATPRRLRVSGVRDLADAQLCFGGMEEWRDAGRLAELQELAGRCWRSRGYGDFWSYMLVAEGAVEIGLDPQVSLWDLAAPMVIVQEAGGRFTDLAGTETPAGGSAIATNGLVHEAARAILAG
ncbi:MAG TPA: inositol monophosphatase family protein [Solirubrobacteraceae bacterium]|nr:inositol monophosphatase family protein [Solirubrobacteraceae bacterium]